MAPPEIVGATPVMAPIAFMMSPTVAMVTSRSSVPAAAEPDVPPPLLKLMVMPLTVSVSAAVKSVEIELVLAAPDSKVDAVIAVGVVSLLFCDVPTPGGVGVRRRRRSKRQTD